MTNICSSKNLAAMICIMNAVLTVPATVLACSGSGMYGVMFGEKIPESGFERYRYSTNKTVYYYPAKVDIQPFKDLAVEVTPASRLVWDIWVEMYATKKESIEIIESIKKTLDDSNPNWEWEILPNHYYGETQELKATFTMIGAFHNGKPSMELTYSCESKDWKSKWFEELRAPYKHQ